MSRPQSTDTPQEHEENKFRHRAADLDRYWLGRMKSDLRTGSRTGCSMVYVLCWGNGPLDNVVDGIKRRLINVCAHHGFLIKGIAVLMLISMPAGKVYRKRIEMLLLV